jgi:hypothetical protein
MFTLVHMSMQEFALYMEDFLAYGRRHRSSQPAVANVLSAVEERERTEGPMLGKPGQNICGLYQKDEGRSEQEDIYNQVSDTDK